MIRYGRLFLAAALIFVVLVGGTDAGRYVTVVRAITAVIGAAFVAAWLVRAPREADHIDKLLLGALLLFLGACVTSQFPRLSLDAAVSASAFTAAAFVARRALADEAARRFAITLLALIGLVLGVAFLGLWGLVWARWISVAGTLPPLDLILPVGPYRHYHSVAIAIVLLAPAQGVMARRPQTRWLGIAGIAVGSAVVVMSGSRTAWLAVAVVLSAVGARWILSRASGERRVSRTQAAMVALGVVAAALVIGGSLTTRLAVTSTIDLRGALWNASLERWLTDPLTGTGPGSFSSSLTLSGFFTHYDGIGRHADNAVAQVLMEGGLLGALGMAILLLACVRSLLGCGLAAAPAAGLALFGLMSFTNNPSDNPSLIAIGLVWLALAHPGRDPGPAGFDRRSTVGKVAAAVAAGVIGVIVSLHIVASAAYDSAVSAGGRGDAADVRASLMLAVQLDPAFALYRRNLAVWLLADGRSADAVPEIERAIALNPGDATSLRVGAMVAMMLNQPETANELARRAAEMRTRDPANPLMLAYTAANGWSDEEARDAQVVALRWNLWLTGDSAWQAYFDAEVRDVIRGAWDSWTSELSTAGRQSSTAAVLAAMAGQPMNDAGISRSDASMAAVIDCDLNGAVQTVDGLSQAEADSSSGLLARILVDRATGDASDEEVALGLLRWPLLGLAASTEVPAASPLVEPEEDARLYSRAAIPAPAFGPRFPTFVSGLSAWLRDPRAAARIGAPASGLATCD